MSKPWKKCSDGCFSEQHRIAVCRNLSVYVTFSLFMTSSMNLPYIEYEYERTIEITFRQNESLLEGQISEALLKYLLAIR